MRHHSIGIVGLVAFLGCGGPSFWHSGSAMMEIEIDGSPFDPSSGGIKVDSNAIQIGSTRTFNVTIYNSGQYENLEVRALTLEYIPQNETEGPDPDKMGFYLRNIPTVPFYVAPSNEGTGEVPEFQTVQVVFLRFDDSIMRTAVVTISSNTGYSYPRELQIYFTAGSNNS